MRWDRWGLVRMSVPTIVALRRSVRCGRKLRVRHAPLWGCWLRVRLFVFGGFGAAFDEAHGFQNSLDDRIVSHRGVHHKMVERASRPIGIEVVRFT